MVNRFVFGVIFIFYALQLSGQSNVIFTQSHVSPLNINPASAGVFYGGSRFTSNYKSQWATVANPLVTYAAAFDMALVNNMWNRDFLAIGFIANADQLGGTGYTTNQASFIINYGKAIDPREKSFVTMGFQVGAAQKSITYSQLAWESQFARTGFDLTLPTGETYLDLNGITNESFIYPDFGWGMQYIYNDKETKLLTLGVSMYHINKPVYQFFGAESQMYRRLTFHGDYKMKASGSHFAFWPKFLYAIQGPYRQFVLGTDLYWMFQEAGNITGATKEITFSIGPYYRHRDGLMAQTRFQVGGITIGLSYDFNLNKLREASNKLGGPEVLLVYKSGFKKGRREKHKNQRFEWRYD